MNFAPHAVEFYFRSVIWALRLLAVLNKHGNIWNLLTQLIQNIHKKSLVSFPNWHFQIQGVFPQALSLISYTSISLELVVMFAFENKKVYSVIDRSKRLERNMNWNIFVRNEKVPKQMNNRCRKRLVEVWFSYSYTGWTQWTEYRCYSLGDYDFKPETLGTSVHHHKLLKRPGYFWEDMGNFSEQKLFFDFRSCWLFSW